MKDNANEYYSILNRNNVDQWISYTRCLVSVLSADSENYFIRDFVLTRCNPVFHELVIQNQDKGLREVLRILKKACYCKQTMALLWCRRLSNDIDSFCLYNDLKHLFTFFTEDAFGKQLVPLALAKLPDNLFHFAWSYSFKNALFIGKVLDQLEAHLIDSGKFRVDYKKLLEKLSQVRSGKNPTKNFTMNGKCSGSYPLAVATVTQNDGFTLVGKQKLNVDQLLAKERVTDKSNQTTVVASKSSYLDSAQLAKHVLLDLPNQPISLIAGPPNAPRPGSAERTRKRAERRQRAREKTEKNKFLKTLQ